MLKYVRLSLLGLSIAITPQAFANKVIELDTIAISELAAPALPVTIEGDAPLWAYDTSIVYSRVDLISRLGTSETPLAAANHARGLILKLMQGKGDVVPQEFASQIKIEGVWHNLEKQRYHAVATLARVPVENYLRERLNDIDARTDTSLSIVAAEESSKLLRLSQLTKAIKLQTERNKLQKSMKKVDVTGRGLPKKWDLKKLEQQQAALIDGLVIEPGAIASDVSNDRMIAMISRGLKSAHIKKSTPDEAEFIIKGQLQISHEPDESGWMAGLGSMILSLYDRSSEEPVGSYQWDIRVLHIYPETAERRVVERAEYLLKKDMRAALINIAQQ